MGSLPLSHQGSPVLKFFLTCFLVYVSNKGRKVHINLDETYSFIQYRTNDYGTLSVPKFWAIILNKVIVAVYTYILCVYLLEYIIQKIYIIKHTVKSNYHHFKFGYSSINLSV